MPNQKNRAQKPMSMRLPLKEALRHRGGAWGENPSPSGLNVAVTLRRNGSAARPVDVVTTLKSFGLSLGAAHLALDQIVSDEAMPLRLNRTDRFVMSAKLPDLGVAVEFVDPPTPSPETIGPHDAASIGTIG